MSIKNTIVNYFACPPVKVNGNVRVFKAPVTMNHEIAKELLSQQLSKMGQVAKLKRLLHVCFDLDSKRLYMLNKDDFTLESRDQLFQSVKDKIEKDFGKYSMLDPIYGSPFSSLRVRSIDTFTFTKQEAMNLLGDKFTAIPIVEVNLDRMPSVAKAIPARHKQSLLLGGYISPSDMKRMRFYDEYDLHGNKKVTPELILEQQTPFIFINMASRPSAPEKEWHILNGYRQYLYDKSIFQDVSETDEIEYIRATIKRFLYLGWTFEEVCSIFVNSCNDFVSFIKCANELIMIAQDVQKTYDYSPIDSEYYVTFKVFPETFPIKLSSILKDGKISKDRQLPGLSILDYSNDYIILKTPVYLSEEKWMKLFKARTQPLVIKYNHHSNTVDVKSSESSYLSLYNSRDKSHAQLSKLYYVCTKGIDTTGKKPKFRSDQNSRSSSCNDAKTFHLKKVSDFPAACKQIKLLAEKNNVPFSDVTVLIGPIQYVFGAGTVGGFMDQKLFEANKWQNPKELTDGIYVSPPFIAIDSMSRRSPAEQASVLVHEYSHHIWSIVCPDHKHKYHEDLSLQQRDPLAYWHLYFNDEDERQAHAEEIKFDIFSGKSVDELIRDKVGGQIAIDTYPIAIKFKELIDKTLIELEKETLQ